MNKFIWIYLTSAMPTTYMTSFWLTVFTTSCLLPVPAYIIALQGRRAADLRLVPVAPSLFFSSLNFMNITVMIPYGSIYCHLYTHMPTPKTVGFELLWLELHGLCACFSAFWTQIIVKSKVFYSSYLLSRNGRHFDLPTTLSCPSCSFYYNKVFGFFVEGGVAELH